MTNERNNRKEKNNSRMFSLAERSKIILSGVAIATLGFGVMFYGCEKERDLPKTPLYEQCMRLEHELKNAVYKNDNYSVGRSIDRELARADLYRGACNRFEEDGDLIQDIIRFRDYTLLDEKESPQTKKRVSELTQRILESKKSPEYKREKEFMTENNSVYHMMFGGPLLGMLVGFPLILTGISLGKYRK